MGGPGEICLPLNIAFAPSTWVALSLLLLLLLLLVEGNLPPPARLCRPLVRRSHKLSLVLVPRSPKERRSVATEAEIFISTPARVLRASHSGNRFCKCDRGARRATKLAHCDVTSTWPTCNGKSRDIDICPTPSDIELYRLSQSLDISLFVMIQILRAGTTAIANCAV